MSHNFAVKVSKQNEKSTLKQQNLKLQFYLKFFAKKTVSWKSKSCRSKDIWEKAVSKALNSNFTEKELHHRCFPGNFLKFLENLFCRTYFYYSSGNCDFQQILLHQTLIIQRLPYEYEKIIWSRKRLSKWKLFWNNFFSRCNLRM